MCKLYEQKPAGMKQMKRIICFTLTATNWDCSCYTNHVSLSIADILSLISDIILQNCGIGISIPRPASRREHNSEPGNCHVCTLLPDRVHRFRTDSHRRVQPQHGPPDRATVWLSVAGLHYFLLWWAAISSVAGSVNEICWRVKFCLIREKKIKKLIDASQQERKDPSMLKECDFAEVWIKSGGGIKENSHNWNLPNHQLILSPRLWLHKQSTWPLSTDLKVF